MEDFVTTTVGVPERPMLIGGEWVAGVDGIWTDVISPGRRGTVLARVPEGSAEDADRAVRAARGAFPAWQALHFKDRQRIILQIADALEARAEHVTALGGTVTATTSVRYGDISGPPRAHQLELRASWTATTLSLATHVEAFCEVLEHAAGLPPVGVTDLGTRTNSRSRA